ncbi:MAG TPA: DNA polymerase III subunit gamma/tau [Candidatus Binatia bacterium]
MSYLVVARKWRPQTFEDIAGQAHITRTLQNAIRTNRIAHAYLFTGVRGVGKTTAARILAKALNCEKGPAATPCNQCSVCAEITSGNCFDVLEIDGASNRGIDEVRQIIENVRYQPAKCRFKIYIIDEVHQVTKDAFNALLKTLEEPPPSVKFILATTEPHRLPETILSRCQRYDFRRIALREIVERLGEIAKSEGLAITEGALVLLAREADGSMRDAQSLLEQVLASAGPSSPVEERSLQEMLGLAERRALYELSAAVIEGHAGRCLELLAALFAEGRDLSRLSRDLVEHFRNLMVARLGDHDRGSNSGNPLLDLPDQEIGDLTAQAKDLSVETLVDYFDFMAAGDDEVARSPNPRFALEAVMVKLATLPKTLPVNELLERLEGLEKKLAGRPVPPTVTPKEAPAPVRAAEHRANIAPPALPGETSPSTSSRQPALAQPVVSGDKEEMWRHFVATVRREKRFLASHLDGAKVLDLAPGRLSIGVGERLELSSLLDTENFASLKNIAKRFFSEDIAIDVKLIVESPGDKEHASDSAVVSSAAEKLSDMANETLRIFPGSSVRSVRREGGER